MKAAIIGGRDFNDYNLMLEVLENVAFSVVISGGAKGADALAKEYALDHNLEYIEYLADWNAYGKRAGMMRNIDIINACDFVIAFWDGNSPGTKNSIELAKRQNKPVTIVKY